MTIEHSPVFDQNKVHLQQLLEAHWSAYYTLHHQLGSSLYRLQVYLQSQSFHVFIRYDAAAQQLKLDAVLDKTISGRLQFLTELFGKGTTIDADFFADLRTRLTFYCEHKTESVRKATAQETVKIPVPPSCAAVRYGVAPPVYSDEEKAQIAALQSVPEGIWLLLSPLTNQGYAVRPVKVGENRFVFLVESNQDSYSLEIIFNSKQNNLYIDGAKVVSNGKQVPFSAITFPLVATGENLKLLLNSWHSTKQEKSSVANISGLLRMVLFSIGVSYDIHQTCMPDRNAIVPITPIVDTRSVPLPICDYRARTVVRTDRRRLDWMIRQLCTNTPPLSSRGLGLIQ